MPMGFSSPKQIENQGPSFDNESGGEGNHFLSGFAPK